MNCGNTAGKGYLTFISLCTEPCSSFSAAPVYLIIQLLNGRDFFSLEIELKAFPG